MGSFIDEHAQCDEVERVLTDAIPSWSRVTPYKHGHIWVYDPHYGWFRRQNPPVAAPAPATQAHRVERDEVQQCNFR